MKKRGERTPFLPPSPEGALLSRDRPGGCASSCAELCAFWCTDAGNGCLAYYENGTVLGMNQRP
jgi:hypothetical protein